MLDNKYFTKTESEQLKRGLKNGGIFLKMVEDSTTPVEIVASDDNGSWRTIETLSQDTTKKIHDIYNNQDKYKAKLESNYRMVSLAWFIVVYG